MIDGQRIVEERDQISDLFGKAIQSRYVCTVLERARRDLITAGRAADPEIDPSGEERFQNAEILGDLQRAVVLQHHAARADADATRARRHLTDENFRTGAGETGRRVMLGQPVPVIAESVAGLSELERLLKGVGRRPAAAHGRLIENAEPEHQLSSVRVASNASRATSAGDRAQAAGFGAS